jgi:hypothetical protein
MKRKKRKANQNVSKEILENLYLNNSISTIELKLDIPRSRIEKLFLKYKIRKKNQSEIQNLKTVKNKTQNTVNKRYGGFTLQSNELKEKVRKTNLKRYGVENVYQSNKIKKKIKLRKKERYGDENFNNSKKYKNTCLKKYGVDNPSKLEFIKSKKVKTSLIKYGVEYPWQLKEIKEKVKNTMLYRYGVKNALLLDISIKRARQKMKELYGVEYGFQSMDIQRKINRNLYNIKEYKFPSGRKVYVMGYENIMLDLLLENNINEKDILTGYNCPIIKWIDKNGKKHKHIPDIFIKSLNKIIEVKSEWTSRKECLNNIILKKKFAEEQGFIYVVNVIDKKTKTILYEINSNKN